MVKMLSATISQNCVMFALFVPIHWQMRDSDEDGSEELVDSTADDSTYVDDSVDDTAGSDVSDENTQDTGNSNHFYGHISIRFDIKVIICLLQVYQQFSIFYNVKLIIISIVGI